MAGEVPNPIGNANLDLGSQSRFPSVVGLSSPLTYLPSLPQVLSDIFYLFVCLSVVVVLETKREWA